jgi:hypothetical protein
MVSNKIRMLLTNISLITVMLLIFFLFYLNLSFILFERLSRFINAFFHVKSNSLFGFINDIPLVLWFTTILFFCFSIYLKNKIFKIDVKFFLKTNFILFSVLLMYSTYFLVIFYLIELKIINAKLRDLVWSF